MRWLVWPQLGAFRDVGLLILRLGLGLLMVAHGWPKLAGGEARWIRLGAAMSTFGIDFAPTFWGLAAALSETLGGLLLAIGLATRPAAAALAVTMFVAASNHLAKGDGLGGASHALELLAVFVGLLFVGPGRYSFDRT